MSLVLLQLLVLSPMGNLLLALGAADPGLDWRSWTTRRLVAGIHGRGGLVSLNHMFGTGLEGAETQWDREDLLEHLVEEQLYGADLIEVGYRDRGGHDLADHLWVWDQLLARGLRPIGVGVSDSHGGPNQRWRRFGNNFVSWIWAPTSDQGDLLEGLRGGRVFFGDPTAFDGRLDLVAGDVRMGGELRSEAEQVDVRLELEGAREGWRLRWISAGELLGEEDLEPGALTRERSVAVPGHVRVELVDAEGVVVLVSNPLWLVREEAEE